ncbi:hypothetical protein [Luteimonas chenhongjianii]|uniref:hypothetical protein n=1 Tax=Luteimonas chenhongjianii TaxID=2006110 RepID=UPI0012FE4117|nr:hypothetical protein [Luteimonas chenhongjianii]
MPQINMLRAPGETDPAGGSPVPAQLGTTCHRANICQLLRCAPDGYPAARLGAGPISDRIHAVILSMRCRPYWRSQPAARRRFLRTLTQARDCGGSA